MRFAVLSLIALSLIVVAIATPAKKQAVTNACATKCGDYDPVCGKAKTGNKDRLITFGSECVMKNFNCQHADDPYEIKSKGECGGKASVLLS